MYAQTQTKYYHLSDQGISQHLYARTPVPSLFKKIFTTGFNDTVFSDYELLDGHVKLILPTNHGFVKERVVKVTADGFSKEYFVENTDQTSITFYDPDFPTSLTGTLSVQVAPLGWELVYELGKVFIYKLKNLDGTDLYLRLLFPTGSNHRVAIHPCLGRTVDLDLGIITDVNALTANKSITTTTAINTWEWNNVNSTSYDSLAYKGADGTAFFVGSLYHLVIGSTVSSSVTYGTVNGILPVVNSPVVNNLPLLLCYTYGNPTSNYPWLVNYITGYVNNTKVTNLPVNGSTTFIYANSITPFITLDQTKTASLSSTSLYSVGSSAYMGTMLGAYQLSVTTADGFSTNINTYPYTLMDVNNEIKYFWGLCSDSQSQYGLLVPLEEIKLD